jgi:hypothetical protein
MMELGTEPNYIIETMLDAPKMEGIDRRTKEGKKIYKLVRIEAKRRGIHKGDYGKRMKRLRELKEVI